MSIFRYFDVNMSVSQPKVRKALFIFTVLDWKWRGRPCCKWVWLYFCPHKSVPVSSNRVLFTTLLVDKVFNCAILIIQHFCLFSPMFVQVSQASEPLVEPSRLADPHLLGLDPGLPGHSGVMLQCRQSGGQEVDGDGAGEYWDRLVSIKVSRMVHKCIYYMISVSVDMFKSI